MLGVLVDVAQQSGGGGNDLLSHRLPPRAPNAAPKLFCFNQLKQPSKHQASLSPLFSPPAHLDLSDIFAPSLGDMAVSGNLWHGAVPPLDPPTALAAIIARILTPTCEDLLLAVAVHTVFAAWTAELIISTDLVASKNRNISRLNVVSSGPKRKQ